MAVQKDKKLFDMELILNNQVKYVEVILDSKLNWKFHIDNRIRKASIAMPQGIRKNMRSETEGGVLDIHFRNKTDVNICQYATLVWWKRTHPITVKKQFGHISSGLLA
jgi:hypothetical protein